MLFVRNVVGLPNGDPRLGFVPALPAAVATCEAAPAPEAAHGAAAAL